MKRCKWWLIAFFVIVLIRVEHTGVSIDRLKPVETILLKQEEGFVVIETDTGEKGIGSNTDQAIGNLHSSSSCVVFLDTARYLIVESKAEHLVADLYEVLRPNTLVCRVRGTGELGDITQFLKIHPPDRNLLDLRRRGKEMQTLYYQEGRGQLVE